MEKQMDLKRAIEQEQETDGISPEVFKAKKYIDNMYRTENYIVFQRINFCSHAGNVFNALVSSDVFYRRTKERDRDYELIMRNFTNMEGKRIVTALSTRKYVD